MDNENETNGDDDVGGVRVFVCGARGLAFYNPQTGRWLSRDPLSEPGFELMANRPENRTKTQEKVHFQKGFAELLAVNPALAMRVSARF